MNTYGVHNGAVARELMVLGFELIKVEPNKKKPQFSVYHFKDSVELQKAITNILQKRRINNK